MRVLFLIALAFVLPVLGGCAATLPPAPQIEYKTVTVNTACSTFKLILVPYALIQSLTPEQRTVFEPFAADVLAHDRAYVAACRPAK